MRYWILDEDETPQGFPLQRLLRRVCEVAGAGSARCDLFKVWGYGLRIHELEEKLASEDMVSISIEEFDQLSEGTEEWFYDVEARIPNTDIRFGLHDSTALFVVASPSIAERVVSGFTNFRPES